MYSDLGHSGLRRTLKDAVFQPAKAPHGGSNPPAASIKAPVRWCFTENDSQGRTGVSMLHGCHGTVRMLGLGSGVSLRTQPLHVVNGRAYGWIVCTYQIVCTERRGCGCIRRVGAIEGNPDRPETDPATKAQKKWRTRNLGQVLGKSAMYFVYGDGEITWVEAIDCETCDKRTIQTVRTDPDKTKTGNLGFLQPCHSR